MNELTFDITQEADGGFVAEAIGESIITQADTWDELRANVREAVTAFYFDRPAPKRLRLLLGCDEVLALNCRATFTAVIWRQFYSAIRAIRRTIKSGVTS